MTQTFSLFAPAKVNLFLHVTGKRAGGYHALQSLMAFADVGDDLVFTEQEAFIVETTGPFAADVPDAADNLVSRAARLLAAAYGVPCRGKITLTKNLPVASGIGGGSADAAAALRGLARLWGLPDDAPCLQKIGLELGADVPVCIASRAVYAEGVGEILTTVGNMPALHIVLVNPLQPVPTARVFANLRGRFGAPVVPAATVTRDFIAAARNDLTAPAIAVAPVIRAVLAAIEETEDCRLSRMSGSGATCFGLYEDAGAAHAAAGALAAAHLGWWVRAAKI